MNSFESKRDGKSLLTDREILQKDLVSLRNAKRLCIKAVTAVVLLPCAIELALAVPAEVMPETLGSPAMAVICSEKDLTDIEFRSGRIFEGGKLVRERLTKGGACGAERDKPLDSKTAKDDNKRNNSGDGPSWDDYVHAILVGLLALVPMIPVLMNMKKPNVSAQGRAASRPSPGADG